MSYTTSPLRTNGYLTGQTRDLAKLVREYRANEVALRRLERSQPVRNVGATERAIERRTHDRGVIEQLLADQPIGTPQRIIVGDLLAERQLNERLAASTPPRPELHARLRTTRQRIVRLINY